MTPASTQPRRSTATLLLTAFAVFALSRLWILTLAPVERSTVGVFAEMAFEYRAAAARGESFYDYHARRAAERAEETMARGGPPADVARQGVEYPPLAVAWIVLPTYFGKVGDFDAYTRAFRGLNAVVDVTTFFLVWQLARRLRLEPAWPLILYALAGLALFHLTYDRLDLVMAALVTAALALMCGRAHWTLPLAVLALAVNFKLVPIVLAPAFVVGATPVAARRAIAPLVLRSATFLAFCAAAFVPFWLAAGRHALGFLAYHAERGVQVESIPANVLLLAGQVTALSFTHGAIDVVSPLASAASIVSTTAAVVALSAVSLWVLAWFRGAGDENSPDPGATIAASHPREIVLCATLLLWCAMATAKVFSPQYLLWLVPLTPLVLRRWTFAGAFLLVCALTTVIFPYRYFTDIARAEGYSLLAPTPLGVTLLTLRNGLFVGLLAALAAIEARRRRG